MSILLDGNTRVVVQGITGSQGSVEAEICKAYGTQVVAGVTPGRGGGEVSGIPVFDTVREAALATGADASLIFVPPLYAKEAVLEAVDAGIRLLVAVAEGVPLHDAGTAIWTVRRAGGRMVGFNTNGIISPGKARMGGLGGLHPADIYAPGRIGVCSRSGGMCAEISLALRSAGLGMSTVVAMGGDQVTGLDMVDYVRLFEDDDGTDAIVLFGEPGTQNELGVAAHLKEQGLRKPVVALIVGAFQERYPQGVSFGHAAAMIGGDLDTPRFKKERLREAGALIADSLEDIPRLIAGALRGERRQG